MEEQEVPTEGLQEELHHRASHASSAERWISWVALSSAIFAALAAVASLLSGHHANEAMIEQLRASDHWSQYQSKAIKAAILHTKIAVISAMAKDTGHASVPAADEEKSKDYEIKQAEISQEAQNEEALSTRHLKTHQVFARAVTYSQIAIALGAISALTRRRRYWYMALGSGGISVIYMILGVISSPPA